VLIPKSWWVPKLPPGLNLKVCIFNTMCLCPNYDFRSNTFRFCGCHQFFCLVIVVFCFTFRINVYIYIMFIFTLLFKEVFSHRHFTVETRVRFLATAREIYGGQTAKLRGFLPVLHTHSFIYRTRCIMFLSQYFSFPLSVSFHHCSILIHSSTTHAV
jgi:hypothetical protein